jgi:hypothetical protein
MQLERRIASTEEPILKQLTPKQLTPVRAQIGSTNKPSPDEAAALRRIRSHLLKRLSALPMNDPSALALVRDIRK